MKIGVDLIEIERIQAAVQRNPRFLKKIFTEQETLYAYTKKNPFPSLAAAFATKEAVRKLDNIFITNVAWQDIELSHDENHRPLVNLYSQALYSANRNYMKIVDVSISHTDEYAVAFVIAIKESFI